MPRSAYRNWATASISTLPTTTKDTASRRPATVRFTYLERCKGYNSTSAGTLRVHYVVPPFPRAIKGKLHIIFAHARQLHLTLHLIAPGAPAYDVYFVDQLSTCIPFLRTFAHTRVLFYCHFPDKLLADGAYVEGRVNRGGILKRIYRVPMDLLEESTTSMCFENKEDPFIHVMHQSRRTQSL